MVAFGACGIPLIASAWPSPIYGATRQFAETPAAGISTRSSAIGVVRRDRGHTAKAVTLEMHGLAGRNSSDAGRRPKHEPSTGREARPDPRLGWLARRRSVFRFERKEQPDQSAGPRPFHNSAIGSAGRPSSHRSISRARWLRCASPSADGELAIRRTSGGSRSAVRSRTVYRRRSRPPSLGRRVTTGRLIAAGCGSGRMIAAGMRVWLTREPRPVRPPKCVGCGNLGRRRAAGMEDETVVPKAAGCAWTGLVDFGVVRS